MDSVVYIDDEVTGQPPSMTGFNTYSLSEKPIGVWVDGRTIYRKTIYKSNGLDAEAVSVAHGISNIERVTNIEVSLYQSSTGVSFLVPTRSQLGYWASAWTVTPTEVKLYLSSGFTFTAPMYITLEYLKQIGEG